MEEIIQAFCFLSYNLLAYFGGWRIWYELKKYPDYFNSMKPNFFFSF